MPARPLRRPRARAARALVIAAAGFTLAGCPTSDAGRDASGASTLVVFNAGSLAAPLRAALDSFAAGRRVAVQQESAGSLETARKLTALGRVPDVVALADEEVFPQLLVPEHASWFAAFARNRMVIAYTDRSRYAAEIGPANWHRVLARSVEVGRSDPDLDPNGYRTLLTLQLAERHYAEPGLMARLLARAPRRNVRPKEADLVALLQAGELDYIWSYESIARATGLRYVRLPVRIDLSEPAESTFYAAASVRVLGRQPGDTLTFVGQPIVYALSIPRQAPHPATAEAFVAYLLGPDGRRVLRAAGLDALDTPVMHGEAAPPAVSAPRREAR